MHSDVISCSGFLHSDLLSCRGSPLLHAKSDAVSCSPSGNSNSISCMRSIGKSIKFRLHFVRRSPPVPTCFRASTLLRRSLPHRPPASASAVRETNPLHFVGLFSPWTPVVVIFCPDTTSQKTILPHVRPVQKPPASQPKRPSPASAPERHPARRHVGIRGNSSPADCTTVNRITAFHNNLARNHVGIMRERVRFAAESPSNNPVRQG